VEPFRVAAQPFLLVLSFSVARLAQFVRDSYCLDFHPLFKSCRNGIEVEEIRLAYTDIRLRVGRLLRL
jgi:hypothetical protein